MGIWEAFLGDKVPSWRLAWSASAFANHSREVPSFLMLSKGPHQLRWARRSKLTALWFLSSYTTAGLATAATVGAVIVPEYF